MAGSGLSRGAAETRADGGGDASRPVRRRGLIDVQPHMRLPVELHLTR